MNWKTITLALSVGIVGAALAPQVAEALPSNEVYRYYYSDASMSVEVGELYVTSCQGVVNQLSGTKTRFVKTYSEPCNGGAPPAPECSVHGIVVPCP